jgi:hypothetical protein
MPTYNPKVFLIQSDTRPPQIFTESKPLAFPTFTDDQRATHMYNGGSLVNPWSYWSLSLIVNALHCQFLGWEYNFRQVSEIPGRSLSWTKIRTILSLLLDPQFKFDLMIFLDSDAWIRQPLELKKIVEDFIHGDKFLLLSNEPNAPQNTEVNSGFMLIKPGVLATRFFQRVWDEAERTPNLAIFLTNWPWEQKVIDQLVKEPEFVCARIDVSLCNTPAGRVLRHCWWKDDARQLLLDELAAMSARLVLSRLKVATVR